MGAGDAVIAVGQMVEYQTELMLAPSTARVARATVMTLDLDNGRKILRTSAWPKSQMKKEETRMEMQLPQGQAAVAGSNQEPPVVEPEVVVTTRVEARRLNLEKSRQKGLKLLACRTCGTEFRQCAPNQYWCVSCRRARSNERNREAYRRAKALRKEGSDAAAQGVSPEPRDAVCVDCREVFEPTGGPHQVRCRECQAGHRRKVARSTYAAQRCQPAAAESQGQVLLVPQLTLATHLDQWLADARLTVERLSRQILAAEALAMSLQG